MLLRRFAPPLALGAIALLIWCVVTQRWSAQAWQTPLQLGGDPGEIYARVQAAAEDLSQPLRGFAALPRLAAPFGADWSRYPISDRAVFTGLGLLARFVGVFAAVNVAVALVNVANALAFYVCARVLRWRREWALAFGLIFAFCSFNFHWAVTVSLSLTFGIPPLILLCGWIARSAPAVQPRRWTWLALALGLWFGGGNPYFGFFAVQLAAGAALLQLLRRRELARWRAGAVFVVTSALSYLVHHLAYFLATSEGISRLTLARNYAGAEIYALKLLDLAIPSSQHRIDFLADLGRAYHAQSALRTEFFINYIGGLGLFGLVLLAGSFLRVWRHARVRRAPDAALGVLWTLTFSAVGGVNSMLALAGADIFRASNRNSIFILVWALFAAGAWIQRRAGRLPTFAGYALAAALAAAAMIDSIPRVRAERGLRTNAARLSAEQALVQSLERRIGRGGMVFQLPSTAFPEAGVTVKMSDYEHFSAYLANSTLRFSYGALRGTTVSRCLRGIGRLPPAAMRGELEAAGFSAIWIDRRGLAENGEPMLAALRALGLEEFAQSFVPEVQIFLLHPAARPRLPDVGNPQLHEMWEGIASTAKPSFAIYEGWYDLERDGDRSWRWAGAMATGGIHVPRGGGVVEISFRAYSLAPGQLVLTVDGREVYRQPVTAGTLDARTVRLRLAAGPHRTTWQFTGRLAHPPGADGRKLGFAVENLKIVDVPEGTSP